MPRTQTLPGLALRQLDLTNPLTPSVLADCHQWTINGINTDRTISFLEATLIVCLAWSVHNHHRSHMIPLLTCDAVSKLIQAQTFMSLFFILFFILTAGEWHTNLAQRLQLHSGFYGFEHFRNVFFFSNRTIGGPFGRFVVGHDSRRTPELPRIFRQWICPLWRSRGVHFHVWPDHPQRNQDPLSRPSGHPKHLELKDRYFCAPRWTSHVQGQL